MQRTPDRSRRAPRGARHAPALATALLTATLAFAAACASLRSPPPDVFHPTFLAYWAADRAQPACPSEDGCVGFTNDPRSFARLVERWRRERGLEIFRFDARKGGGTSVYAGAWRTSDRPHRFEPDLTWDGFERLHRRLARTGFELVHLKVYEIGRRPRLAAIWRPGDPSGSGGPPPTRIEHDLDWQELREDDERLRRKGLHLAEIEVYPGPDGPDDRWVAGVWQPGTAETRLVTGLRCDRPFDHQVGVPLRHGSDPVPDLAIYARCRLFEALEALNRQGYQPVDFERYRIAGAEAWAVLLHRRSGADWLRLPASTEQVGLREARLNPERPNDPPILGAFAYSLLDFDLLDLPGHVQSELRGTPSDQLRVFLDDFPNHNGLVHDGSTAGPPGG